VDRRDVEDEEKIRFNSAILPPYLRRSKNIDDLIPWLYLRGVSSGDFSEALQALVGPQAKGLSANVVTRLLESWKEEYATWNRRDPLGQGVRLPLGRRHPLQHPPRGGSSVHFGPHGSHERRSQRTRGHPRWLRESEQSWRELLADAKSRGLKKAPKVAVGDGALGFWKALRKVYPKTREQRCWVHKTANVLNKLPKSLQAKAKSDLHEIWMAETRENANAAFDRFVEKYGAKYPRAVNCLTKDREALMTFYDFPAEHWIHLRTTNPIESTFATVRLRHQRTKGNGNRLACLSMVFKLVCAAEKKWRKLNGSEQLGKLLEGYTFVDGIMLEKDAA